MLRVDTVNSNRFVFTCCFGNQIMGFLKIMYCSVISKILKLVGKQIIEIKQIADGNCNLSSYIVLAIKLGIVFILYCSAISSI